MLLYSFQDQQKDSLPQDDAVILKAHNYPLNQGINNKNNGSNQANNNKRKHFSPLFDSFCNGFFFPSDLGFGC